MSDNNKIRVYGTKWCGHSRVAKRYLSRHEVEYEYIDINEDKEAAEYVMSVNNGNRSVPTLLFPDGTVMTEPSNKEIGAKLGLEE